MIKRANEVLPGLWVSDARAATDCRFLQKHRIGVVFNVTPDVPTPCPGVVYHRVPIRDPGPGQPRTQEDIAKLRSWLPAILETLHAHLSSRQNVLVHCHAGVQRSAAIVAAYILAFYAHPDGTPLSLSEVKRYLRSKRPQVFAYGWSVNFREALVVDG